MDVINKLQEGEIYRWSYRDPKTNAAEWGDYHCCSRIAVVQDGRLRDTYWSYGFNIPGGSGRSFGMEDLPRLDLKFLARVSDLQSAKAYEADYYDDADIVDLRHANGGSFHLRKGAVRSQAKMLASARYKLEQSESEKRSAEWSCVRLRESIAKIEAGDTTTYI